MFGRGIDGGKGWMLVKIAVIEFVHHDVDRLFELFEIDPHAKLIEFGRTDRNLDLPVVPVRVFAVARIGPEVMPAGKMSLDKNIHGKKYIRRGLACKLLGGVRQKLLARGLFLMVNNFYFLSISLARKPGQLPGQRGKPSRWPCQVPPLFSEPLVWSVIPPGNDELTSDTLFQGRLQCRQYRQGYRFSVDAILAAHFSPPVSGQCVLDLGCGSGIIGLIVALLHPDVFVAGLELQDELAALATDNASRNGLSGRFAVTRGNVQSIASLYPPEAFDLVICNPPYRKRLSGRVNQTGQAAIARHELTAGLADFVRASAYCVKNKGRVVFVYPAGRCSALLAALAHNRLVLKRLQPVYSYPEAVEAKLILAEAIKNGGEHCELMAPFYLYERKHGRYSQAMQALYAGGAKSC